VRGHTVVLYGVGGEGGFRAKGAVGDGGGGSMSGGGYLPDSPHCLVRRGFCGPAWGLHGGAHQVMSLS